MKLLVIKLLLSALVGVALALPFFYPSLGSGFVKEMQLLGTAGSIVVISLFLGLVFLYCKDLQKTLELIAPKHRVATPKSVWLMFLIPYNFIEDFFIIHNIARSLENESASNARLTQLKSFGLISGLGWCSAQILSLFPNLLGQVAGLIALVLWVVHWRFIHSVMQMLKQNSD